jgi:hypothetical protein
LEDLKQITTELLHKHNDVTSIQSKKTFDRKMKDLETKFLALSDEFNTVSSERDNLRSKVQNSLKDKSIPTGPNAAVDGVNIHDFAQSVWSQAMTQMPRQARKSSERSTRSQEECLERLKREQKKKSSVSKSETKIRNWNDKDD